MGFLHVGQAGLELFTSGFLPTLASRSAGIIGMSHLSLPHLFILDKNNMSTNSCYLSVTVKMMNEYSRIFSMNIQTVIFEKTHYMLGSLGSTNYQNS